MRQAKQGFYINPPPKSPPLSYTDYNPSSTHLRIQIIYRDKIKVYYSSQAAAHADDYHECDNQGRITTS